MDFTNKTVLVIGMARTGIAAAKTLAALGARVIINDLKSPASLPGIYEALKGIDYIDGLGQSPAPFVNKADMCVLSPSVPASLPVLDKFRAAGKPVFGEIELAFRLCKGKVLAISGTNGKTTTTTLTGEICKAAGKEHFVVGNIGNPFIADVLKGSENSLYVAEISSYQLETAETFRPHAAALLNITPDHLDRHKTMGCYVQTKYKLFANQTEEDYAVLNYDDPLVRAAAKDMQARVLYFSTAGKVPEGLYLQDGFIVYKIGDKEGALLRPADIGIRGLHNLQNAMAAAALTLSAGIPPEAVRAALKSFKGVEHRIETVRTVRGVTFINDSKGTNPDSTIKAIHTMDKPTILLLGGYDKHGEFGELISEYTENIQHTVVLGETKGKIAAALEQAGIKSFTVAGGFQEAVQIAYKLAYPGYNVLLSPACASFDMFTDFEERGRVFKEIVNALPE